MRCAQHTIREYAPVPLCASIVLFAGKHEQLDEDYITLSSTTPALQRDPSDASISTKNYRNAPTPDCKYKNSGASGSSHYLVILMLNSAVVAPLRAS